MAVDIVVVMLLLFSLLSFAISGFRDFMRWNHYADKFHGARANHAYSEMLTPPDDYSRQEQEFHEEEYREMTGYKGWEIPKKIAGRTMWMTLLLEFRLPPVIALISLLYYIVMRAT